MKITTKNVTTNRIGKVVFILITTKITLKVVQIHRKRSRRKGGAQKARLRTGGNTHLSTKGIRIGTP